MDARVAIVGAGPAGALLSYLLASRGIDTLLIERQSDFSREFRGEVLMPSGIRALEDSGLDLSTVSSRTPTEIQAFMNRRRFLSVRAAGLPGSAPDDSDVSAPSNASPAASGTVGPPTIPMAVSQPELLERLVELADATGHFELRRGTTVRRIETAEGGSRRLHLRSEAASDGANESVRVPYMIGSDGRGSVCRRSLAPRVQVRGTPLDIVWFKLPYPAAWNGEPIARFEIGKGHLLLAVPAADGLLQIAWVIVKGTYGELKHRSAEEWAEEMSRHSDPELSEHLHDHGNELSRPFLLRAITDRVHGWAAPGALLIGDAAHTMSPVGAQGLNIALRDAIVTANELVPAFHKGGDLDAAAARVEALRGPEVDRIQRIAGLPPRLVLGRTVFHEGLRRLIPHFANWAIARNGAGAGGGAASAFLNGVTKVELRV